MLYEKAHLNKNEQLYATFKGYIIKKTQKKRYDVNRREKMLVT